MSEDSSAKLEAGVVRWAVVAVPLILAALAVFAVAGALIPSLRDPLLFGLYCIPANSVLPVPHEPGLLYFAPRAAPWLLATAGTAGAFVAAYLDSYLIRLTFARPFGQRVRGGRLWRWCERASMRAPFLTTFVTALVGLPPIQLLRVLLIAAGYPTSAYAAAVALGRFPRFFLIAVIGSALAVPAWLVLTLLACLMLVPWLATRNRATGEGIERRT